MYHPLLLTSLVSILVMPLAGAGPAPSVNERIAARNFPSVFQAWNPASVPDEDPEVTAARHDLIFHAPDFFELRWVGPFRGRATVFSDESIKKGRARRDRLRALNPNLILLAEIRYRDAHRSYLPENDPWWKRDAQGQKMMGWAEGQYYLLDFSRPDFQEQVARQAEAAVRSGVVDGIMLDWWQEDNDRLALLQTIRKRIGNDALVLVNANDRKTPQTASLINGYFMECTHNQSPADWKRIADTLAWAENHLRPPRINCLETWWQQSRNDQALMRATTTLSLVLSDGYCLFSDPNPLPTPDHAHNWYPFWDQNLGRPLAVGLQNADGLHTREFERGTAAYNPMGALPASLTFPENRRSAATGKIATRHTLAGGDGDLYLRDDPPAATPK